MPPPAVVVPRWPASDAEALLAACEAHGVEGLVLKRLDGTYRPVVRSDAWRKVKCDAWRLHHVERRGPHRTAL